MYLHFVKNGFLLLLFIYEPKCMLDCVFCYMLLFCFRLFYSCYVILSNSTNQNIILYFICYYILRYFSKWMNYYYYEKKIEEYSDSDKEYIVKEKIKRKIKNVSYVFKMENSVQSYAIAVDKSNNILFFVVCF